MKFARLVTDTTDPVIALDTVTPDPTGDETPSITGTVTDSHPLSSVQFQVDITSGSWSNCVADDGVFDEVSETFGCTPATALNEGEHTVYVRGSDDVGNTTGSGSESEETFTVDLSGPSGGSIVINGDAAYTNTTSVTLTLSATDLVSGVSEMILSESSSFTGETWETYNTTKVFTLSTTEGTKTVYVKFRDSLDNESASISDSIILDTSTPTGESTTDSGVEYEGTTYSNEETVNLVLEGFDSLAGVVEVMISEDPNFSDGIWVTYAENMTWDLSNGDGIKVIYVKYRDAASNESEIYTVTLFLDTTTTISLESIDNGEFNDDLTDWNTNNMKPVFIGTGEADSTVTVTINSDPITGQTIVGDDGSWTFTPDINIPVGAHTVTIDSEDIAGNTDTLQFSLTINAPAELPETGVTISTLMIYGGSTVIILIIPIAIFYSLRKKKSAI